MKGWMYGVMAIAVIVMMVTVVVVAVILIWKTNITL